jgi:CheY-like chemotaxis protein
LKRHPSFNLRYCMSRRILIADDNPRLRKTLRHLLEDEEGCEVIEVEDGKQALSRALELRPDIILLDLVMPVMDGLAAAREISKQMPEIPMIMYTMHTSAGLQVEAQKFGVRKVVSKENSRVLIAEIRQLLATDSPPSATPTTEVPASVLPMMVDPPQPNIETPAAGSGTPSPASPEKFPDKAPSERPPE